MAGEAGAGGQAAAVPIAMVGCGAIAHAYLQALQRVPTLRLVGVVDPAPAAAAAAGQQGGAPTFADLPSLFASGLQPRAALVLAPPDQHEPLCCELLARGLHVLCEKPLAPTLAAAQRMLAAAHHADRRLMMGSKFRYTQDVLAARRLLDSGFCGTVVMYENVFCAPVDMTRRWNADPARSGGGVLIDNGCHSVDLARYLLGPLARVQAQFGPRAQAVPVEDTARLLFTSTAGALGSIDLSWSVHKETPAYVRIHGTQGTLEIGWQKSRHKALGAADWTVFGQGYDKVAAFAAQLANFAGVVQGREPPGIDDADALASVVVVATAYQAQREERWLPIPTVGP
ncbi:MAG: Gfo/Idh/MocA family oxidoreductase [Planctomycetes bacterium]|nr:Gfo/Idh/MocA family oxidoreductase [Planctomycetota bacterium]